MRTEFCGFLRTLSWEINLLGGLAFSTCVEVDAQLLSVGQTVQDRLQDRLNSRYDSPSRCRTPGLGNNPLSIPPDDVHCRPIHVYWHVIRSRMASSQSRTLEQSVNWSRAAQLKAAGDWWFGCEMC